MQDVGRRDAVARFDCIYEAHHAAVYAYLLGRTNDDQAARDLLQEAFLRVWRHIDKTRDMEEDNVRYWLFRIAKNVVIGYHRKQRQEEGTALLALDEADGARLAADPSEVYTAREAVQAVDAAIRRLPDELRVPLVMQVLGGMTSTQIGQVLGRPAGTVRYQIARARRLLAEALGTGEKATEALP
ncbi:MAG: RNA polymerase sigma factor [Firmicutes bacterium]|jgi:RNA polymerase sigma-70 factor (ECF subfamily)|nr:RNA polymerase sigma factor [Bacillota bacterium]